MKKFYITTSIVYTNAPPHLGFALELIQADVIARYQRYKERDVFFLTGTDEHGTKIEKKAEQEKKTTIEFCDEISDKYRDLIKRLSISNSDFIRTSDRERHWPGVYEMWRRMKESGDIYEKEYEGLYCVGCEAFIMPKDLVDEKCPYHKTEPEEIKEKNYFFKLSRYSDEIERLIKEDSLEIFPSSRKEEILSFLRNGLNDISISRSREKLNWGIPVLEDDSQIIYVWADALVNYISAIGYGRQDNSFNDIWPADVHFVGKDISKFHALIWPGMLLSAGLELPHRIFIHGFLTVNNEKMSKSLGNVVSPLDLIEKYGSDAFRYYFLREISPTEDGDFSYEKFNERYNSDLASGLGNLVSRTITLASQVERNNSLDISLEIKEEVQKIKKEVYLYIDNYKFNLALSEIWKLIKFSDQYIEKNKPWEKDRDSRSQIINDLIFILKEVSLLISFFMPDTSKKIISQIESLKSEALFKRI
jgi:methionyl-tRNA synthetase